MARAAALRSAGPSGGDRVVLHKVEGVKPLTIGNTPVQTHIGLFLESGGALGFEIYVRPQGSDDTEVYSRGTAAFDTEEQCDTDGSELILDINTLKADCDQKRMDAREFYDIAAQSGFAWGESLKSVRELHLGKDMALARLALPKAVAGTAAAFGLHPVLMDAALKAAAVWMNSNGSTANAASVFPVHAFSLSTLDIRQECAPEMWAVIHRGRELDGGDGSAEIRMDLCDETGVVRVRMEGFRALNGTGGGRGRLTRPQPS